MDKTEKTFGQIVTELRRAKGLKQEDLAKLVSAVHKKRVASSTISRIEQDTVSFSSVLGLAIIKALNPPPVSVKDMKQALTKYQESFELPMLYGSGAILDRLMSDYSVNNRVLCSKIGKVHQAVQAWRRGVSLMSDEMLVMVAKELSKLGAPKDRIDELISHHIYDVLITMSRLTYLSKAQRKKIAEAGSQVI